MAKTVCQLPRGAHASWVPCQSHPCLCPIPASVSSLHLSHPCLCARWLVHLHPQLPPHPQHTHRAVLQDLSLAHREWFKAPWTRELPAGSRVRGGTLASGLVYELVAGALGRERGEGVVERRLDTLRFVMGLQPSLALHRYAAVHARCDQALCIKGPSAPLRGPAVPCPCASSNMTPRT